MRTLLFLSPDSWQSEVLFGLRPQLGSLGYDLCRRVNLAGAPDLIITHQDSIAEALKYDKPTIILERVDGCQLTGPTRRAIADLRIRMVLKSSTFADLSLHNRYAGRAFVDPNNKPKDRIADEHLGKIRCGFSYASCSRFHDWPTPDMWKEKRQFRASFAGTVDYPGVPEVQDHRRSCAAAVAALPGCISIPTRSLDGRSYRDMLADSRVAASPFGLGEICWRDYEGIVAGCFLARPKCEYEILTPEFLFGDESTIAGITIAGWDGLAASLDRLDASGLFESIDGHNLRVSYSDRVRSMNTPEAIAKRLAAIFEEAVG